jgi:hypothetical protein
MANSRRIIDVDAAGRVRSVERAGAQQTRERLKQLAWLLDSSIPIPGTRITVGLEALIGLFPFIGDLIGVLLSSYILGEAARLGAPKSVLLRMSANVALEGVVGIVPFAGDIFDAAYKANQRNVRLLEAWLEQPRRTVRSSRLLGAAIVALVVVFLVALVLLAIALVRWIAGQL